MCKKHHVALVWAAVCLSVLTMGCHGRAGDGKAGDGRKQDPGAALSDQARALEIAKGVSKGIGTVGKSGAGGATGPILVFEEEHTSPTVRLEEAIALVRLYRDHGLRAIGMEGAPAGEVFDGKWFHDLTEVEMIKPGVAVGLLGEGEINVGEFMAMVFPDVRVVGIEDPALYAVTPPKSTGTAVVSYLLRIAIASLSPEQAQEAARLLKEDQEKGLDYVLKQDPWVAKMHARIQDKKQSRSIDSTLQMYQEIKQHAEENAVEIPEGDRKKMEEEISFFSTAKRRSGALVGNLQAKVASDATAVTAMVIGAGHTEECCQLLSGKRASFAVISPASLLKDEPSDLSQKAYERKLKLLPVSDKGLGSLLAQYLPRPVMNQPWCINETKLRYVAAFLARLGAGGKFPLSDKTLADLTINTGIEIDAASLREDDGQVVFAALVPFQNGQKRRVYCRAAKVSEIEIAGLSRANATEKLLEEHYKQLKAKKKHTNDLVALVAPDTIAKFSESAEEVKKRI